MGIDGSKRGWQFVWNCGNVIFYSFGIHYIYAVTGQC